MMIALVISALVHGNILVGLGRVYLASPPPVAAGIAADLFPATDSLTPFDAGPGGDDRAAGGGGSERSATVVLDPLGSSQSGFQIAGVEDDSNGEPFLNADAGRGNGKGGGVGDGQGKGQGKGKGFGKGRVGFFGTEGNGTKFVFIVDCSRSMKDERFGRARNELSKTLEFLTEDQEFSIIFFSNHAIPMYAPKEAAGLVKADESTRKKARKWMMSRGAFGETYPDEAFQMALRMKPDVIYFLTDGEFNPSARDVCRRENTDNVTIHTIAFCTRKGESLLRDIAADNGGRYRFVK
ncbi:MAG: VWA domain-containing protein [Planctomycetaceae bacterium]|nr:VWA domain-containing protein [Planctomycetaceae bacterium]